MNWLASLASNCVCYALKCFFPHKTKYKISTRREREREEESETRTNKLNAKRNEQISYLYECRLMFCMILPWCMECCVRQFASTSNSQPYGMILQYFSQFTEMRIWLTFFPLIRYQQPYGFFLLLLLKTASVNS